MSSIFDKIKEFKNSKDVAIYYKNKEITFNEFFKNVCKMTSFFKNIGICENDVVTLVLPNILQCVYSIYALNSIGAIINILHFQTPFDSIIEKMNTVKSKYVILMKNLFEKNIDKIERSNKIFVFANPVKSDGLIKNLLFKLKYVEIKKNNNILNLDDYLKCKEWNDLIEIDGKRTAFYLHSGGTTGNPKIIGLSNSAIIHEGENLNSVMSGGIMNKSVLSVLPVFHTYGFCVGIHGFLCNYGKIYLMKKFDTDEIIEKINIGKINSIIGIPSMYEKLLNNKNIEKCNLKNLHECFLGGDSSNIELIKKFNDFMEKHGSKSILCEGYGLTETASAVTVNRFEDYKIGSVGKCLENNEIKIFDDKNTELKENQVGEIYIHSKTLMNDYLNKNDDNKESVFIEIDGKKYLKTGDLGYLDSDGYLFLKGRKKRMFKISGINVYPSDVENIALEFCDISDAALECFGNDKKYLVLFLIRNKNNSEITEKNLKEHILNEIKKKTIKYNWPSKIIFLDKFPRTNIGKIDHNKFVDNQNQKFFTDFYYY